MNPNRIEKELRFLKIYAALMTIVSAVAFGSVMKIISSRSFDEIVQSTTSASGDHSERPAGIMFFGEKGDEIGGLVFDGNTGKGQGGSLTFDKFRGDQTIQFIHEEDKSENYFAGLKMNDQNMPLIDLVNKEKEISKLPTKEAQDSAYQALRDNGLLMTERLRIGRDYDKSSVIKLKDAKGKVRIELKVEANGNSKLNFLDEIGKVIYSLPKNTK